jgi:hypothetical protein
MAIESDLPRTLSGFRLDDLLVLVVTASPTNVMWPLLFAAIGTVIVGSRSEAVVGTPHVAPGR